MKIRFCFLLYVSCTIVLTPLTYVKSQTDSVDTSSSIREFADKLSWLHHKRELARYRLAAHGYSDSLAIYDGLYRAMLVNSDNILDEIRSADTKSDEDQRIAELLVPLVEIRSIEETALITALRDSLLQIMGIWSASHVMNGSGESAGVYAALRYETNRDKREAALREICVPSNEAADIVSRLFSERNRLARLAGYANYYALIITRSGYSLDEAEEFLKEVEQSSEQRYRQMIANLANEATAELWDIGRPAAKLLRAYGNFFPSDSHLINLKSTLFDIGFDLNVLPVYIDKHSDQDGIFLIDPPNDIRLMVKQSGQLEGFMRLAAMLSKSLSASKVDHNRGIFSSLHDDIWFIATSKIVKRLCYSRKWLSSHTAMSSNSIKRFMSDTEIADNMMARFRLMEVHFEREAYLDPSQNLHKLYWNLCERYLGVSVHDDIDALKLSHDMVIRPLSAFNELAGEMAAAQVVAHLKNRFDDVTNNNETSSFLTQNYYRFGSRYRWQELLLRGTDEKLNPVYLINQTQ